MSAKGRYWARILAANVAAALVVAVFVSGLGWRTPWRRAVEALSVSLLFAMCIGTLVALVMPRLGPHLWDRYRFPLNWAGAIAVMVVLGVVGSTAAVAILTLVGYIGPSQFGEWFRGSLRISIITTLTFGIFATVYEVMHAKLDATTLALRTKERDEADARRLAAEAQVASLESRVNPHFLFNTLNSIAELTQRDPAGAERMTGQLASLMRSSLDTGSTPLLPLDQELRVVGDYLEIERVRFGARLRYTLDVGEGTADALVPRLALQTLVENSIKYAVSPRRDGGAIVIRASAANGRVVLAVEDDGPGFDPAAAADGHGLELLKSRLAMTFGDRAALRIESRPGHTRVTVDMPRDNDSRSAGL